MSYSHLSIIERSKLEILHRQGKSSRAIAKELGRHSSTICRELDRANSSYPYQAEHAQNAYEKRRQSCVSSGKWSSTLAASLEEKLKATWSPEQINQRFRTEGLPAVSFKTIYPISIDRAVRSGMRMAVYRRVLRSMSVPMHPLLFPRLDTTVSSSQCPNVSRERTSWGRSEMDLPMANLPRVSAGF